MYLLGLLVTLLLFENIFLHVLLNATESCLRYTTYCKIRSNEKKENIGATLFIYLKYMYFNI